MGYMLVYFLLLSASARGFAAIGASWAASILNLCDEPHVKCVMCNGSVQRENQSESYYSPCHEWCETYY